MSQSFADKLELALKILSMSRSQLAAELGVDKSVASRWVSGSVKPSAHNLSQLTAMIARRTAGFTILDWDRDLEGLARKLGADETALSPNGVAGPAAGVPLTSLPQILATTAIRASAYEGFWRSTRYYAQEGNALIHDHGVIRRDDNGLLRLTMGTAGVFTDAWMLPLHNQVYCFGAERTTGSPVFGIFHGAGGVVASVLDGLTLSSIHDVGRTPTASPIILHRIGDLSGDRESDDATFARLAQVNPVATLDSIPKSLLDHLLRDIGPAAAALGGEMLMQMPLARSMTK
jgi:transcriptional regulator with XRE-family HTH domain